jgi:nitrilase
VADRARVAALQMCSGVVAAANLASAERLLREARARDAVVACLPENFLLMGHAEADKLAVAEVDGDGPVQARLGALARELGIWIVAGTLPIRTGEPARVAAAVCVYDASGERVARYDKIHLFDVDIPGRVEQYRESASVRPGEATVCVDTPAGRLGLSVCYDLRFPELYRALATDGAEWFCVPAAFTAPTGRAHWRTLLRARAIENLAWVVAPAQSGFHANGRETHGESLIVEPWGAVAASLPRGTGVVCADFDLVRQRQLRQNFPCLSHRRLPG